MEAGDGSDLVLAQDFDCRSHNSSPVRLRAQPRPGRVRGALNRSCSVPDSNNPPCLAPPAHSDISVPVCDLTEIGADEAPSCSTAWSQRLHRLDRGQSCDAYCCSQDHGTRPEDQDQDQDGAGTPTPGWCECENHVVTEDSASPFTSCEELEREQHGLNHALYTPNNHMTKSMLCLNEESQDEVSVRTR